MDRQRWAIEHPTSMRASWRVAAGFGRRARGWTGWPTGCANGDGRSIRSKSVERLYPKPQLLDPAPGHRTYRYRLEGLKIERPDPVWSRISRRFECGAASSTWRVHGLVQPIRGVVGSIGVAGCELLRGGAGIGVKDSASGNLQLFIARLWRTVKYEEVYLKDYKDVPGAIGNLRDYFLFYNHERPQQSLGKQTPAVVDLRAGKRTA